MIATINIVITKDNIKRAANSNDIIGIFINSIILDLYFST